VEKVHRQLTECSLGKITGHRLRGAARGPPTSKLNAGHSSPTSQKNCFTDVSLYRCPAVPTPFSRRKRTHVVRTSAKNGEVKQSAATRVGLKPGVDWHKRNFLTEVLIPSLFTKRSGHRANPLFPKMRAGEICITWIGHA